MKNVYTSKWETHKGNFNPIPNKWAGEFEYLTKEGNVYSNASSPNVDWNNITHYRLIDKNMPENIKRTYPILSNGTIIESGKHYRLVKGNVVFILNVDDYEMRGGTTPTITGVVDGILHRFTINGIHAYTIRNGKATAPNHNLDIVGEWVNPVEMTMEEIETKLGYSVKLVEFYG